MVYWSVGAGAASIRLWEKISVTRILGIAALVRKVQESRRLK
jgi:hypothetical protein